ncbi:uncharacterized protein [Linepithema humile]|uniref:uncharacterized protein n=1 Tax=Linepithema humile TaxID=83485 RepID=UPI000623B1CC|nr:PREDICTED: uncharacterized protein LOC105673642 [Linepithema humile]
MKRRYEDKATIANRHLQLLLDIPIMQREAGGLLRQTLDSILRHLRALEQLKDNLDVSALTNFLEERCFILKPENPKSEAGKTATATDKRTSKQTKRSEQSSSFATTSGGKQGLRKCAHCQEESHVIYSCPKFQALDVPKKQLLVKALKLCWNCVRSNHFASNCTSTHCKKCNSKHNTLLHVDEEAVEAKQQPDDGSHSSTNKAVALTSTINLQQPSPSQVLLSTARVWMLNANSGRIECRVILDSGSQLNFMTRELCRRLGLPTQIQDCCVKGLGPTIELNQTTEAVIQSRHTAYCTKARFLITEQISERLPMAVITVDHLTITIKSTLSG